MRKRLEIKGDILRYRKGILFIYHPWSPLAYMALEPIPKYENRYIVRADLSGTFERGDIVFIEHEYATWWDEGTPVAVVEVSDEPWLIEELRREER